MVLRGLSAATQERYLCFAQAFVAHYRLSPRQLTTEHVRQWLRHLLVEKKRSAATVNVAISALRFMFGSLGHSGVMRSILNVRKKYPAPDILSGTEVARVLEHASSLQYKALFMLLYGSGLRITEARSLEMGDIDSTRMVLHVRRAKNRYDRIVPLPQRTLDALRAYYREARPKGPLLFPGSPSRATRSPRRCARRKDRRASPSRCTLICFDTRSPRICSRPGWTCARCRFCSDTARSSSTARYTHLSEARRQRITSPLDLLGTKEGQALG
jgi:integrase